MTTIVIDASPILYASVFSKSDMRMCNRNEVRTECTYRIAMTIYNMYTMFNTNRVVLTFDSKINNRKKMYPTYKANRKEVSEDIKRARQEIYAQIPTVQNFLTKCNIPWFCEEGFESDDVIASICYNNGGEFILGVSDHDMFQLLRPNVTIYNLYKAENKIYTDKHFISDFGISPRKYHQVLGLAGCPTDNIEGIRGVGEKKAIQFLNKTLPTNGKIYKTIMENKETYYETLKLVKLPLDGCPVIILPDYFEKNYNYDGFISICDELEFDSFYQESGVLNLRTWKAFFGKD